MGRRQLVKMVVFGLAWSVIVSLCIGQTDDESFLPGIRYLRMRPKFPIPTTPHPANLEEAKRWFKEAFYADVEGLLAQRLGKPESVWKGYYRQVAKLAREFMKSSVTFLLSGSSLKRSGRSSAISSSSPKTSGRITGR
jgi:hypothetical protein